MAFNIRIYGVLIENNKVLIVEEPFMGEMIHKFPGGGMEFGEGAIECLKREFKEELNLNIEAEKHIYTQDFFMQSALNEKEQIVMIYYKVRAVNIHQLKNNEPETQKLSWIDLNESTQSFLSLQTDKRVIDLVIQEFKKT